MNVSRKGKIIELIPFYVNSDAYEFCRDALAQRDEVQFRVSTGLYLYQGFCETVLRTVQIYRDLR